jgi:hypothetical protein
MHIVYIYDNYGHFVGCSYADDSGILCAAPKNPEDARLELAQMKEEQRELAALGRGYEQALQVAGRDHDRGRER